MTRTGDNTAVKHTCAPAFTAHKITMVKPQLQQTTVSTLTIMCQ